MSWGAFARRLNPLPDPRSRDEIRSDVDDEFMFHLESLACDLVEEGMSPEDARRHAQERFGNVNTLKRECERIALEERLMARKAVFIAMIVITVVAVAFAIVSWTVVRQQALEAQEAHMVAIEESMMARELARRNASAGQVHLLGSTMRTGSFSVPKDTPLTIHDFIEQAGGFMTHDGSTAEFTIRITRDLDGDARTEDDRIHHNVRARTLEDLKDHPFALLPGDVVAVFPNADTGVADPLRHELDEERAKTEAITRFLTEMLTNADPQPRPDVTGADLLQQAEQRATELETTSPEVAEQLRETIRKAREQMQKQADKPDS